MPLASCYRSSFMSSLRVLSYHEIESPSLVFCLHHMHRLGWASRSKPKPKSKETEDNEGIQQLCCWF
ncbi:unnamed protein product [Trifolium pratense]|uniref:Uncharacterized protein n=1 Tax=Trifolium pratense TaxID=57577 RepID=A0ACB0LB38_TRIPR|nr:unnamed protein product [Trifolium pratense]